MTNKIIKTVAAMTFLAFGANQQFVTAQTKSGITKRVTLTKLKPCVILTGAVQPKNFDTYIFQARKNQTIVTDPFYYGDETDRPADDEEGSSGFEIIEPGGKTFRNPQDVTFTATRTGEFKILVRPTYHRTNAKYVLKISVTDKMPKESDDSGNPPTCP